MKKNIKDGILYIDDTNKYISEREYQLKSLNEVHFFDGIKYIEHEAFIYNKLKTLELPTELIEIGEKAFAYNNINSIKFNDKLKIIGNYSFMYNKLNYVELPDSVEVIGPDSFDDNVVVKYKNYVYDTNFTKKFGFDNIINGSKIVSIVPNFNFESLDDIIIELLPKDIDSIKGYMTNYKEFDKLVEKYNIKKSTIETIEIYKSFFKMCYTLGLFNTGGSALKETKEAIEILCNKYNIDDINQMFNQVYLTIYKPKFREIIICEIDNDNLKNVIGTLYDKFNKIKDSILIQKEEKIGILSASLKDDPLKLQELEEIKKIRKQINLDEVLDYIINYNYRVDDDCLELKQIIDILSIYLNQIDFNRIQRLYRLSKYKEHTKYFTFFYGTKDNIKYEWLSGDNPLNIILGYECDCCSKLHANGEDIMIQSMINPSIKTLVLYDRNKIIGKSTAYYDEKNGYLIFNNVEIRNGYKPTMDVFYSFMDAIEKQKEALELKGYVVNDIRIGMKNNNLDQIIKNMLEIEHNDLLKNYNYSNYEGDANSFSGQAIVKVKK